MAYKLKRDTIRNFEKLTYNLKCARHEMTPARALHLIQKEENYKKKEIITMIIIKDAI